MDVDKSFLRKWVLTHRRLLASSEFSWRNQQLLNDITSCLLNSGAKVVHLFMPIAKNREPDLRSLIQDSRLSHIQFVTSIVNWSHHELRHVRINSTTEWTLDLKGIPIPTRPDTFQDLRDVTHVLVPLLLFDGLKHRLGYGGGYYDQLLTHLPAGTRSIGISLGPGVDRLTTEPWDIALNQIITPFT